MNWSALRASCGKKDREPQLFAPDSKQGELAHLLVHHVGHARTRNHQDIGRFGLLQAMLGRCTVRPSTAVKKCLKHQAL
jgi:hypothetical protein